MSEVNWLICNLMQGEKTLKRKVCFQYPVRFYIALFFVVVIVIMAMFPHIFTAENPITQDMTSLLEAPSSMHWFGTDEMGRDVFARVVYGTRVDLMIGIFAMLVPALVGTALGLLSGYYGGKIDMVIMRILDMFMAFPTMVMVIAIVAIFGSGMKNLFLAIWLVGWREYAKLVRSEVLTIRNSEYILAAEAMGYSDSRILLRHIFPNVINSVLIYAISDMMMCILLGASLSFLGLGVPTPIPEWGSMISEGRAYLMTSWWITAFPGVMLACTGIAINIVGEELSQKLQITD